MYEYYRVNVEMSEETRARVDALDSDYLTLEEKIALIA